MKKKEIIEDIIKGISEFKIIPFLGAGMSRPCGALDWKGIITELKKELKTKTTDFLLIGQEYEDKFGRNKMIERLVELCSLKNINSESLEIHMKILAMNPPILYTTNYDNAIEEASKLLHRNYKKVVGLHDIVESKHGENQIIKFHGDFNENKSIVFTRNDYDKRLEIDKHPLDILFRSHILGKSVLFLGYGFGDENIDYIFKKHNELYGTGNLPKSYIISFNKDSKKEKELKEKNIITLALNSVNEFSKLISEINRTVFNQSIDMQFKDMFKPMPSIVLPGFELASLESYINSTSYSTKQKHNKIRETLEGKTIPKDIEHDLHVFFEKIINGDYHDDIKEAILIAFQHTKFRNIEYILKLSFDLMGLSENPKFRFDLNEWGSDVIMVIERKFGDLSLSSLEVRKWMSLIVLAYLEGMKAENKKLSFEHVDRLLDSLKNFGYDELGDLGTGFTPEHNDSLIEYYLNQHSSTLRARFKSKGIGGRRIPTVREIMDDMMKGLPKNLNK
mgnify:CR=1 FL=1